MEAVIVRPAQIDEIPFLQARLAEKQNYEQVDLSKAVVFVVEEDGIRCGMVSARPLLVWQIEPLMLFRDFLRVAPGAAKRRAAYRLLRAVTDWITEHAKTTPFHALFAYICDRRAASLVERFGLVPIYRKGRFWGKDL